jgi:tetratricopeptide (TPR) repeat protein
VSDSSQIEESKALIEATRERVMPPVKHATLASVRISPGGYLAFAAILTFASLILLRAGRDLAALIGVALTWIIIPILIAADRITFDGQTLFRRGLVAAFARFIKGRPIELRLADIERAETTAVRTVRRGGRVRYRYRTEVAGKGISFVFASGSGFRRLVKLAFASVSDDKLDARTRELRDHLTDSSSLRKTLQLLRLASSSFLDNAVDASPQPGSKKIRHQRAVPSEEISSEDIERARLLRAAANQLRIAGRLRESAEAFRRALLVMPNDGGLLYEFARLLRSQASALGQARLLSRARAALRLAVSREILNASSEYQAGRLLNRMGETFLELGDAEPAARAFRRALEINPRTFRAQLGLADVALRDGKLAHVIHHYNDAARIASDEALVRFARREADYYARLNDDEDYLAAELRRINWLQNAQRVQSLAARSGLASILLALVGPAISPMAGSMGLAFATSSIVAWAGTLLATRFLRPRRRFQPAS